MKNEIIDLGMSGYEELFMTDREQADLKRPKVEEIPLSELTPFRDHPFQVRDDDEMDRLKESIRISGVLVPALVRPKDGGGYELISGHRRMAACRALGMDTMPVIVRKLTDEEAVIAMVDANLQREHILPSEKAFAYKMKMDAMEHQGTSRQVGTKLRTDAELATMGDDSARQIQRYIRLTNLIPPLLELVDQGRIAFSVGVELSYLDKPIQEHLAGLITRSEATPSYSQALRMHSENGRSEVGISAERITEIMSVQKPNQQERVSLPVEKLRRFFPENYTPQKMQDAILRLVEEQYRRQQRSCDRDAR